MVSGMIASSYVLMDKEFMSASLVEVEGHGVKSPPLDGPCTLPVRHMLYTCSMDQ
jgi:hypothetical protein